MRYCKPIPQSEYWIREVDFECQECGKKFQSLLPHGDELVKFVEEGGTEERWLPTYGLGGYLYLVEKLVPNYRPEQSLTMAVSSKFEKEFLKFQVLSKNGQGFLIFTRTLCPSCNSKNLLVKSEKVLQSPGLSWLEYRRLEDEHS